MLRLDFAVFALSRPSSKKTFLAARDFGKQVIKKFMLAVGVQLF